MDKEAGSESNEAILPELLMKDDVNGTCFYFSELKSRKLWLSYPCWNPHWWSVGHLSFVADGQDFKDYIIQKVQTQEESSFRSVSSEHLQTVRREIEKQIRL